jgi:hypothetical protein
MVAQPSTHDFIRHHGAVDGVTGSCHELTLGDERSILMAALRARFPEMEVRIG